MAGLGNRGKGKIESANALFQKTENMENQNAGDMENHPPVKKSFAFSFELAEALREHAFRTRRKEVDIVRDALDMYFKQS